MRIYRTLEQAKDDLIRVGDIIDYCNESLEVVRKMRDDSFEKVGHGLSDGGLYGFIAYAKQQEELFGYHVPNVISYVINKDLQTEDDKQT